MWQLTQRLPAESASWNECAVICASVHGIRLSGPSAGRLVTRGRSGSAGTVAPSMGVVGGDWWHCVHSWSPARPSCTFTLSEKS